MVTSRGGVPLMAVVPRKVAMNAGFHVNIGIVKGG